MKHTHTANIYILFKSDNNLMIKRLLLLLSFLFLIPSAFGENININDFDELINSSPDSGDTLTFTNDLDSTSSIGNYFSNLDIIFEGNDYYINGAGTFGGFVLNSESTFNQVGMRFCQGQTLNNSKYAGAIFNNGGDAFVANSAFLGNFVNSSGFNFGVGGAIYNVSGGNMDIDYGLISNNYSIGASSYGGAISNGFGGTTNESMTINHSILSGNYAQGSVVPCGGAIYNNGTLEIMNTTLLDNYVTGENDIFGYGGGIYNVGPLTLDNVNLIGNYAQGDSNAFLWGGAIYNNNSLTINNSTISGNHIDTDFIAQGGAIMNDSGGVVNITNSVVQNNYISSSSTEGNGGGIYNSGILNISGTTFRNNKNQYDEMNDIYNTGTVNLESANILSGIAGSGTLNKTGSGTLNLGGVNENYTGNFNFESGNLNLLAGASYFTAQNTTLENRVNFNMRNGEINNINFGNLTLNGTSHIFADINFNTNTMDRINASSLSGDGNIFLEKLDPIGTPKNQFISIPFADSVLKDSVNYTPQTIETPIYNYNSVYNSSNGDIELTRGGFNSSVFIPAAASQIAGYLAQIDTYKNIFSNLDMVMIQPPEVKTGYENKNKIASMKQFAFSPFLMPEENPGIWFKPYTTFENVPLRGGVDVSNVSYGALIGGESGLKKLKKGWYGLYGAYTSYNGSHQAFDGNSIYNNGGLLGIDGVLYKGGFFTAWTADIGANSAEASSRFGKDNFVMLNTGIAEKTGYNWEVFKRKLIIQPSLMMSYNFINTFNYTSASDLHINADPLHAIHIEPQIKLIGNFKNYLQPYISVSMVWNILDNSRFQANDVYIPELSVKPFVQYGAGIQKRWGERLTGFFETMIRNGGRNGIALMMGFRISL